MRSEDEERLERLKAIVRALPEKPGSYQYYDAEGIIIYVGKAKNLKARVSSYFQYNPRYNVLLKDGKTYPSICITKEYLPRIFPTRTINKKWGTYYGPYSHVGSMHAVLELINKLYQPRLCKQPITEDGIKSGKYHVCLDYHIKKCAGPCVGKQSWEDYQKNINQAREILKGNTREVLKALKEEMHSLSEQLRFEECADRPVCIEK